jgi:hypothetical protein
MIWIPQHIIEDVDKVASFEGSVQSIKLKMPITPVLRTYAWPSVSDRRRVLKCTQPSVAISRSIGYEEPIHEPWGRRYRNLSTRELVHI